MKQKFFHQAKKTINLSSPIMATQFARSAVSFICTLMVAKLGHEALAASALVTTAYMVLSALSWGILSSIGVLVAQNYGAGKVDQIALTVCQGFWLAVLISLPIVLVMLNATPLLLVLGQSSSVVHLSQVYLSPLALGLFPSLGIGVLQKFIIGIGRARIIMINTSLGAFTTIIFSYILTFGKFGLPAMGIAGVGLGTALSYLLIFIMLLGYILLVKEYKQYRIFSQILRPDWNCIKKLWSIGWPIGALYGIELSEFLIAVLLCGLLGSIALAAYQITLQCVIATDMVIFGLAEGTMVLVGQAVGATKYREAKQVGYVGMSLAVGVMFLVAVAFLFFPKYLINLFFDIHTPRNATLLQITIGLLAIAAFVQLFDGLRMIAQGALRGIGDTRLSMWMGILCFYIISLPLGYLLAFHFKWGAAGLWSGTLVGVLLGAGVLVWRFQDLLTKSIRS